MRAFIVYESMFGNTKRVAESIQRGLSRHMETEIFEVSEVSNVIPDDVGLLIIGAPTHAFGLSREGTRVQAKFRNEHQEIVSRGRGVREWLNIVSIPDHTDVASFSTRIATPKLPGTAGSSIRRRLRRLHAHTFSSVDFLVGGTEGPLIGGELIKAEEWGDSLGQEVEMAR